jgi:hypothetical protein
MATVIMTIEASATTHRYDGPLPRKTLAAGKTPALLDLASGHRDAVQHHLCREFGQVGQKSPDAGQVGSILIRGERIRGEAV